MDMRGAYGHGKNDILLEFASNKRQGTRGFCGHGENDILLDFVSNER